MRNRSLPEPPFRPELILETLERHEVKYVVIGGLAATLSGSPYPTADVDITPARSKDNFARLAAALSELGAKLRVEGQEELLEIPLDERTFGGGTMWAFVTDIGLLDVALLPDGTRGYDDLRRDAFAVEIVEGLTVRVASLRDVIRSKEAAGRTKDLRVLPDLREVLRLANEESG